MSEKLHVNDIMFTSVGERREQMRFAQFLLFVIVAACSSTLSANDPGYPAHIASQTTLHSDQYTGQSAVIGPLIRTMNKAVNWSGYGGFVLSDRGFATPYARIRTRSASWLFVDRAFADGQPVKLNMLNREVVYGGITNETVVIYPSAEQWEKWRKTGTDVKLVGSNGSAIIQIHPAYWSGVTTALEGRPIVTSE